MGCGGSPGLALHELTLQEAEELAAATVFATFDVTSVVPPPPSGLPTEGSSPFGWAIDFEAEVRCPGVGIVGVAADAIVRDEPTGGETVRYRLTQVHNGCGVRRSDDRGFAVSGFPRSSADMFVEHDGSGRVQWSGSTTGELRWVQGDREGSCTFELTLDGRSDEVEASATLDGSMCGQPLRYVVPLR